MRDLELLAKKAFLRPDEAARILEVSRRTMYRWCANGEIESVRLGGVRRISCESLMEAIGRKKKAEEFRP